MCAMLNWLSLVEARPTCSSISLPSLVGTTKGFFCTRKGICFIFSNYLNRDITHHLFPVGDRFQFSFSLALLLLHLLPHQIAIHARDIAQCRKSLPHLPTSHLCEYIDH